VKRIRERIEPWWDKLAIQVPVNFSEVDSMKIVWHGHYLRYAEAAREVYCAARGMSYQQMEDVGSVAPLIRCQLEFLRPARMGRTLTVTVAHIPDSEPTLDLFYEIRDADGTLLCVVETVQVFVDLQSVPFLSPPPPVEAFFGGIRAREAVGRPSP
jgi:acyl-CoA thioester hydrolase